MLHTLYSQIIIQVSEHHHIYDKYMYLINNIYLKNLSNIIDIYIIHLAT